jgi:hypothetical protein
MLDPAPQLLEQSLPGFDQLSWRAAEQGCAIAVGIVLENGHDKHEPVEWFELRKRAWRDLCLSSRSFLSPDDQGRQDHAGPGGHEPDRILDDHTPAPRAGPFLENGIPFNTFFETGDKALLGFAFIGCQRESKPVQDIHILVKDSAKIPGRGVLLCPAEESLLLMPRHSQLHSFKTTIEMV